MGFSIYYNETRTQTNVVVVIDVVVVHIAVIEVRVPRVVSAVLRRRPVVVAKAEYLDYVSLTFYCSTFDNTNLLVEQSLSLY